MAADPAGQLRGVRAWLHGQGITAVSDEWLAACLEHVTQSSDAVPPSAELQRLVLDQWLDTDLATLSVSALPPRLADQPVTTLRQPCAVQLLSVVDVSQPAHGQLLKLRRLDSANTEVGEPRGPWEPRPSRALRLTLTDGVQRVAGLECEPLPELRADSAPGLKLLLRPPLECRRGVLLLRAASVAVLGGVVEELQDPHSEQRALEERLRAAGGVPPAGGPTDEDSGYRSDLAAGGGRPAPQPDPFDDDLDEAELAAIPDIPDDDIDDAELAAMEIPDGDAAGAGDVLAASFDDVDDAELASLDLDSLVDSAVDRATSVSAPASPGPAKRRRTDPLAATAAPPPPRRASRSLNGEVNGSVGRCKPPQRQQRLDSFLRCGSLSESQSLPAPSPAPSARPAQPQRAVPRAASPVRSAPSFDLSSWIEADDPPPPPPPPPRRPEAPFGYLSDLQPNRPVTVKAFIMTMVGSMDMSGGRWRLKVRVNDGTRSILAVLPDAVLTRIIGLSVAEADRLRLAGRTDTAARTQLKRVLCDAQTAIIRLSCLMRLEMTADDAAGDVADDASAGDQLPVITELTEVSQETVRALRACVGAG